MDVLRFQYVDAFTHKIFGGNPAAVTILETELSDKHMQALASEINLSETAFIRPQKDHYDIRWFTPNAEVDLCGHATLASAHHLWKSGYTHEKTIRFRCQRGFLQATQNGHKIQLDFPVDNLTDAPELAPAVEQALGVRITYVAKNSRELFTVLDSENQLLRLQPDYNLVNSLPGLGLIVTAASSSPNYDFKSRCFFPKLDIPEDPVTGSAHCSLAPYWSQQLGKNQLSAHQASKRGGDLELNLKKDRVLISGEAVSTFCCELPLDLLYSQK